MRKAPTFRSSPEPFPHAPHGCRQQNLRCPDFCPYYGIATELFELLDVFVWRRGATRKIPCWQGISPPPLPAPLRVERRQIVARELVRRVAELAGHGRHRLRAHFVNIRSRQ